MRRVGLNLDRAAARIRQDIWDDLWPDPLGWMELPSTKLGASTARRHVDAFRKGKTVRKATVALVPKPNGLMRPAHILTPWSRLYYQALVDTFMFEIDRRLAGRDHVFGYRTMGPRLGAAPFGFGLDQWKSFRRQLRTEVDSGKYGAFVRTDIAAFFERIPHGALEERLAALGVRDDVARELRALLKALMGKAVGLPQGPDVSAVLANCYLQPLDQAILSAGYGYVRYVDDIVLLARDRPQAKLGLRLLEHEARELDLLIQSAKTTLVVGPAAMKAEAHQDDEIGAVDYVVRRSGRRTKTLNRPDFSGDSILWRKMESWQSAAAVPTPPNGGIRRS